MFNIVDLIAILFVLVCAIVAFKRGFVKTLFGFLSTFLAIIIAFAFCNAGTQFLKDNTEIDEWMEMTLTNAIVSKEDETKQEEMASDSEIENTEEKNNDESNMIEYVLKDLPKSIQDAVNVEEYKINAKKAIIEKSVPIILKVLAWIVIYLGVRLILWILCVIFNGIMNIPFLKQINNIAGLFLGVILGVFRIYIVLAFISFLVSVIPINSIALLIKESMIVSVMYENNLLIKLIF